MKNRLLQIFSIAILLTSTAAQAQDKRQLSLAEAIDLSIKNSHQLKFSSAKMSFLICILLTGI